MGRVTIARNIPFSRTINADNTTGYEFWPFDPDTNPHSSPKIPPTGKLKAVRCRRYGGGDRVFTAFRIVIARPAWDSKTFGGLGIGAGLYDPFVLPEERYIYDSGTITTNPSSSNTLDFISDGLLNGLINGPFAVGWYAESTSVLTNDAQFSLMLDAEMDVG